MSTPKNGAKQIIFGAEERCGKPRKLRPVKSGKTNIPIFHNCFHRIVEGILATCRVKVCSVAGLRNIPVKNRARKTQDSLQFSRLQRKIPRGDEFLIL